MFEKTLTKEFLLKKLIDEKVKIMELANQIPCSKSVIIKYCKKLGIYDEIREKRVSALFVDLTDKPFGKLIAKSRAKNNKHGHTRWNCVCECGRTKIICSTSLVANLSKSCGYCSRPNFTGYEDISGSHFRKMKESAQDKSIEFKITIQDIWNQYLKQNKKCSLTGICIQFFRGYGERSFLQTASVDRIDSSKGYTIDNIQIIHKKLQPLKMCLSMKELKSWCKLIVQNLGTNDIMTEKELLEIDSQYLYRRDKKE